MKNIMLISSGLLKIMWDESLYYVCYILNKISYNDCDKIPYD